MNALTLAYKLDVAMRLCHVITGLGVGGAETALSNLLEVLHPPEFVHTVVALGPEGAMSARVSERANLHHLDMQRGRLAPGALLRLRNRLNGARPDVIHGWMYHANLMTTVAAFGLRVPLIWGVRHSLHDLAGEKYTTRLVIRVGALLSRFPVRVVYNSKTSAIQHASFGFSSKRAVVIPNGFNTDKFAYDPAARERMRESLGVSPDEIAIGVVARVHPTKDHATFLHAAVRFAKDWPRSAFILVGDGATRNNKDLVSMIDELGLQSRVRLCGRRADIAAVDNALDIACLSSKGEAFPNVVAEAMACETPCVATAVGDTQEIIGDTGFVVAPHDPGALCSGWLKLAQLGACGRSALGMRARQRIVDRYSLVSVARQYAELYASVGGE